MDLIDAFGVATRGHCLRASPNSEMVLLERCSAERSIERFDGNADIGRGRMQLRLSRTNVRPASRRFGGNSQRNARRHPPWPAEFGLQCPGRDFASRYLAYKLHRDVMRLEQPPFFHHQHHRQRGQRAQEKAGRERQQRAVEVLAHLGADADPEQRGDRAVQR